MIASCSHSCLLCLCQNREYPLSFQNKLVIFLEWRKPYFYPIIYLGGGGNVNYYKSVHHPIPP